MLALTVVRVASRGGIDKQRRMEPSKVGKRPD
jgi:hypothetical protein